MRLRVSVFTRLFLIMIVSGIIVNVLVSGFFRHQFQRTESGVLQRNMGEYAGYLIERIGIPPDISRARELSKRTMLEIAITGPTFNWSTARPPDLRRIKNFHALADGKYSIHPGRLVIVLIRGGYRFVFFSPGRTMQWVEEYFIVLIVLVTVVLSGAYFLIRRVLLPVRLLSRGVKEIASGNMEHQVPVRQNDELGELTESFNNMKNQIRGMLVSREQLLRDVSHELRTPLTRIKVALEFIADPRVRADIDEEVLEIDRMVTGILESERLAYPGARIEMSDIDIAALAGEAAGALAIASESIFIEGTQPPAIVRGDRQRVRIVIRNVLENAVKYSSPAEKPIRVIIEDLSDTVRVEIRDQGSGIPEKELPYVFQPFYRVDSSRSRTTGGYGLGLSICRKIMEAHGGSIDITSVPGEGTSVFLNFKK